MSDLCWWPPHCRTPIQIDTPAEEGLRGLLAVGSLVEQAEGDYRWVLCCHLSL